MRQRRDEEVTDVAEEAYRGAHRLLSDHRDLLDEIAERLLSEESIEHDEIAAIMAGRRQAPEQPDQAEQPAQADPHAEAGPDEPDPHPEPGPDEPDDDSAIPAAPAIGPAGTFGAGEDAEPDTSQSRPPPGPQR
jgi:cell division protease FtsH